MKRHSHEKKKKKGEGKCWSHGIEKENSHTKQPKNKLYDLFQSVGGWELESGDQY